MTMRGVKYHYSFHLHFCYFNKSNIAVQFIVTFILRISLLGVVSLLGYRTILYCTVSNMQVSLLVVYI